MNNINLNQDIDSKIVQLCLDFVKNINELQKDEEIEISINIENSKEIDSEE